MPTLLIKNGYRFFFFISEPKFKVPHVHVQFGKGLAVFWLEPSVFLQKNKGLNAKELTQAQKIVIEYKEEFLEKYYELISPRHK